MRFAIALLACALAFMAVQPAGATILTVQNLGGAASGFDITTNPPNPVAPDPNNNLLVIWNEKQNVQLTSDLLVDRVADPNAPFVTGTTNNYKILAGTIVSSHYVQWDPNGSGSVTADLVFDSDIFAFITADSKMFGSDDALGLDYLDYNDFTARGLEAGDTTSINGNTVSINWTATSPGDWTRLITAYSPAAEVPVPGAAMLLGSGLLGLLGMRFRRRF